MLGKGKRNIFCTGYHSEKLFRENFVKSESIGSDKGTKPFTRDLHQMNLPRK